MSSYFEVSKPFKNFFGELFTVQVELNWQQTTSFTNSSSLHTSCLLLVQL